VTKATSILQRNRGRKKRVTPKRSTCERMKSDVDIAKSERPKVDKGIGPMENRSRETGYFITL